MTSAPSSRSRFFVKAFVPIAIGMAIAPAFSAPVLADSGSTVSGKVSATPTKYLGETVVYLKNVPGSFPASTIVVDQKAMTFTPHVAAITVGDTVSYGNHDKMNHNVFSPDNEGFNLGTFPPGETRSYTFHKAGVSYSILCSVHPEMLGYVFVAPNPYHAVVDASGAFAIPNVPPGTYTVAVWNPKLKAADQTVTVAAGAPATVNFTIAR